MLLFILAAFWVSAFCIYLWLLSTSTGNTKAKLRGMPIAFLHLFLSRDNKWKRPTDPEDTLVVAKKAPASMKRKRVYLSFCMVILKTTILIVYKTSDHYVNDCIWIF